MFRLNSPLFSSSNCGGAAIEYVIVSIFGLVLAVGSITLVGRAVQDKVQIMEEKLGIKLNLDELNPLGS